MAKEDLNKVYITINEMSKSNQNGLIDLLLSKANVSSMPQEVMIVYLDSTFDFKNKLKNRDLFCINCKKELESRNEKISFRLSKLL